MHESVPPTTPSRNRWPGHFDRPDMRKQLPGNVLQRLRLSMDRDPIAIAPRSEEANQTDSYQNNSVENDKDKCVEEHSAVSKSAQTKGEEQHQQCAIIGQLPTCCISLQGITSRALINTGS